MGDETFLWNGDGKNFDPKPLLDDWENLAGPVRWPVNREIPFGKHKYIVFQRNFFHSKANVIEPNMDCGAYVAMSVSAPPS